MLYKFTGDGRPGDDSLGEETTTAYLLAKAIVHDLSRLRVVPGESEILAIEGSRFYHAPLSVDSTLEFRVSNNHGELDPAFGIATCVWAPKIGSHKSTEVDPEYMPLVTSSNFGFCFMSSDRFTQTQRSPHIFYHAELSFDWNLKGRPEDEDFEEPAPVIVPEAPKLVISRPTSKGQKQLAEYAFLNGQRITLQQMREYEESLLRKRKAI